MNQAWLFDAGAPLRRRRAPRQRDADREDALRAGLEDLVAEESDEEARRVKLLQIAGALLRMGRPRQARNTAQRILDEDPRNCAALFICGHASVLLEQIEEAEEVLATTRLLVRGPMREMIQEDVLHLAQAIFELRQAEKRRRERRRPLRAAPARRTPAVRRAVEMPRVPPPEIGLTLAPRRLHLPALEEVAPETALADYLLRREAVAVERLRSFETLLALGNVSGVDRYDYQLRTVRRVLRDFRGRVLLADEVGLGKTVEACLCLKEYFLRGLARRALILVPPALRGQWRDELAGKFGLEASVVDGDLANADPSVWTRGNVVLASLGLVRLERHARHLLEAKFDLVIVDEAHRLKNRRTRSWQLVDRIRSRFLLLLSATPVENDLIEIYNVLSLLKPGLFSTQAEFKKTFVKPGQGRVPKDPAPLRALLREVMIRNTRALAEAKLPPRFAATLRAAPDAGERALYEEVSGAVKKALAGGAFGSRVAGEILRATAACPAAAEKLLRRHLGRGPAERARAQRATAKDALLADLLGRRAGEKVLIFAAHRATLNHLFEVVRGAGRNAALFHGSLTARAKEEAVLRFARDADVLVASESGGEGFNLQFARTIVNYDLPWNPMRIEQRIGRVHRIGQTREVFVFNLVNAGTLEEEILRVLDEKINMFELVVGEVEAILGRLGDGEQEFQDLILEIYRAATGAADLRARFDALASRLVEARGEYRRVQELETKVFGRDLEA